MSMIPQNDVLPEFLANYQGKTGSEELSGGDLAFPFLAIGQAMNPKVQAGDAPLGSIFCPTTGEILADSKEKPIAFYPFIFWKVFIKWGERGDNTMMAIEPPGGEGERSVRAREKITRLNGKTDFIWTQYNNYGVVIDGRNDWFVLSCYRTNIRSSRHFNSMIERKPRIGAQRSPIFAWRYTVETRLEKNQAGQYFIYHFDNAGIIKDQTLFEQLRVLNEEITRVKDSISMASVAQESSETPSGGEQVPF